MNTPQTDSQELQLEEIQNAKSAKKFLFILMLIPIGLGCGVALSNINFRKEEEKKSKLEQFKVSELFDKDNLQDDMEKILASSGEDYNYFLRHISSTLGINNYLVTRPTQEDDGSLGYYDIVGEDEEKITVVIVELDEVDSVAKSSLLAAPTAVIKSLAGEKSFSHTLRFVFLPKKFTGNQLNLRVKGESIVSHYLIRVGGGFTLDDEVAWRSLDGVWSHPAMALPHESLRGKITEGRVALTLQAARQLKSILEAEMQK